MEIELQFPRRKVVLAYQYRLILLHGRSVTTCTGMLVANGIVAIATGAAVKAKGDLYDDLKGKQLSFRRMFENMLDIVQAPQELRKAMIDQARFERHMAEDDISDEEFRAGHIKPKETPQQMFYRIYTASGALPIGNGHKEAENG